jgi:hypothetical protein
MNAYRMLPELPVGEILLPTLRFGIGGVEPFGSPTILVWLVTLPHKFQAAIYCCSVHPTKNEDPTLPIQSVHRWR